MSAAMAWGSGSMWALKIIHGWCGGGRPWDQLLQVANKHVQRGAEPRKPGGHLGEVLNSAEIAVLHWGKCPCFGAMISISMAWWVHVGPQNNP